MLLMSIFTDIIISPKFRGYYVFGLDVVFVVVFVVFVIATNVRQGIVLHGTVTPMVLSD